MAVGASTINAPFFRTGRTSFWDSDCFIGVYDGSLPADGNTGYFLKHTAEIWDHTGYGTDFVNILPLPGPGRSYYLCGMIFTPRVTTAPGDVKLNIHAVSRDGSGNPVLGRIIFTYMVHWRSIYQVLKYPVENISSFPVAIPVGDNLSLGFSANTFPIDASMIWWVFGYVAPLVASAYS